MIKTSGFIVLVFTLVSCAILFCACSKSSTGTVTEEVTLPDGELIFIEIDTYSDPTPRNVPEEYIQEWTWQQVVDYLGRDFRPSHIPEDLIELNIEQRKWTVSFNEDGTFYFGPLDTIYREDFDDTYNPLRRSLHIIAEKGNLPPQYSVYLTGEETPSNIRGNEITVCHWKSGYGAYQNPDGYFDIFIARFIYDGIGYAVESENLSQEEFISVLLSIIK